MNQKQLERRRAALQRREQELARWKTAEVPPGSTPEVAEATRKYFERKIAIAEREVAILRGRVGQREY